MLFVKMQPEILRERASQDVDGPFKCPEKIGHFLAKNMVQILVLWRFHLNKIQR